MTHVAFRRAPYEDTVVRERPEKKILAAELFFRYRFNVHIPVDAGSRSITVSRKASNATAPIATVGPHMKSLVVKRSVVVAGHKTSVSLEDPFWKSLKEIATSREVSLSDLLAAIDSGRHHGNLSSAIRLFVLNFYREQLLHRLDVRDKREAIQGLISGSARKSSKTPPSS
jgi:predicted DNA-binding ribbon-helix-helix protein